MPPAAKGLSPLESHLEGKGFVGTVPLQRSPPQIFPIAGVRGDHPPGRRRHLNFFSSHLISSFSHTYGPSWDRSAGRMSGLV